MEPRFRLPEIAAIVRFAGGYDRYDIWVATPDSIREMDHRRIYMVWNNGAGWDCLRISKDPNEPIRPFEWIHGEPNRPNHEETENIVHYTRLFAPDFWED